MSPHTPGPWGVGAAVTSRRMHQDATVEVQDVRGQMVALLYTSNRDAMTGAEDAANAHLIAAAPELLALVKQLRHVVYEVLQLDPVDGVNYRSICEQADLAIAKAEGTAVQA